MLRAFLLNSYFLFLAAFFTRFTAFFTFLTTFFTAFFFATFFVAINNTPFNLVVDITIITKKNLFCKIMCKTN